ncbi:MAG: choloylglycine hydrolase family protein [Erythrobacter sp.]|uniref:choloylglycine hydrolase family protein n=1 Tax=Erythrobacter sp. TaxID=1042 RepID=UPI00261ECCF2|nr:choloylglycine hydrolase family protein [Erythrobacter sp.]MDJ0978299.1 choloylglycine hydrolase family protein [Erythrobacter sp.]
MKVASLKSTLAAALAGALCFAQAAQACTGIMLQGEDGSHIRARTMEWSAFDLESSVTLIPPGFAMAATMADGKAGATWTTKYGYVGATGLGKLLTTDGLNEKGLSGGIFYLPGFADFPEMNEERRAASLGPTDVINYFLGNFATVAEVREAMADLEIVSVAEPALGFTPPVHYFVADATGDRLVIEVVGKEVKLHEAPLGVITNSPAYDWHITNLRNYINLSATALPTRTVSKVDFAPLGAGSGMIGLPGDFTPPSRFVRAVAFSQTSRPTKGGYDTVRESFRILDNFNVPAHGVTGGEEHEGGLVLSSTQFTSSADMNKLRFYYHTQHNRRVRMIDLNAVDFGGLGGVPKMIAMDKNRDEDIEPVRFGP